MTAVPQITLNNGVEIPQLGFGVFQIKPEETVEARDHRARGRLPAHRHRRDVRQREGGRRGHRATPASTAAEVFVTSKLNNGFHELDDALRGVRPDAGRPRPRPARPVPHPLAAAEGRGDFVQTWKAMEGIYARGRARAIGVSNFQPHHLRRLHEETDVMPAVNQIEVHPYLTQDELRAFDAEHGIATEAWSPIAQGGGARRPVDRRHGRAARQDAGAGRAALAHPARRHRVPEVGHASRGEGELRDLRLRAVRRRRWSRSPR